MTDAEDSSEDSNGPQPMEWWDMLVEDVEASAREYDQEGWKTLQLHPADVTPLDGEYGSDVGLDVLVPDNEFAELETALTDATVDGYEVYRSTVAGYVALIVVVEDRTKDLAILFPAYYQQTDQAATTLFEQATDEGELTVFLRGLSEERVELTLDEPALLAPPDDPEPGDQS